jgi:hypothetical protein
MRQVVKVFATNFFSVFCLKKIKIKREHIFFFLLKKHPILFRNRGEINKIFVSTVGGTADGTLLPRPARGHPEKSRLLPGTPGCHPGRDGL